MKEGKKRLCATNLFIIWAIFIYCLSVVSESTSARAKARDFIWIYLKVFFFLFFSILLCYFISFLFCVAKEVNDGDKMVSRPGKGSEDDFVIAASVGWKARWKIQRKMILKRCNNWIFIAYIHFHLFQSVTEGSMCVYILCVIWSLTLCSSSPSRTHKSYPLLHN